MSAEAREPGPGEGPNIARVDDCLPGGSHNFAADRAAAGAAARVVTGRVSRLGSMITSAAAAVDLTVGAGAALWSSQ